VVIVEALTCRPAEAAELEACEHSLRRPRQHDFHGPSNRGGWSGRGGRGVRGLKVSVCYFHGRDKGHWTNECPIAKQKKEEMEKQSFEPPKSVNYTSGEDKACPSAAMSHHVPNYQLQPRAVSASALTAASPTRRATCISSFGVSSWLGTKCIDPRLQPSELSSPASSKGRTR
jgi:hypothetical protein